MKLVTYALLVISLLLSPISVFASQWEYQVKSYLLVGDDQYLTEELNKLGSQGWQLVNCTSTHKGGKILCTFTRKKSQ